MKRNTLLVVVVAVAAIFLLFNPLKYLTGNQNNVSRPAAASSTVNPLLQYAEQNWHSPEDYVVSTFASKDIVFLGDMYKVSQHVELVNRLIPRLYAAGIRNLGIEYALSDDQKDIDALVTAPAWDEAKARAITFDWLVTWGYQEYIDLYKTAWQVNSTRPAGAAPFRIVGLSPREDWTALQTDKDAKDPAVIAKLYANGVPDAHIAEVIDREFLQKGLKALIYCGTAHTFTRYRSPDYEKNAVEMKLAEVRRAGAILYAKAPSKIFAIFLHAPWPDARQKGGLGYPVDGLIDAVIEGLPEAEKSGGWNLAGTPFGALSIDGSIYAINSKSTLADLFDGYIVLGPIGQYMAVTAIADFVRPEDAEKAARNFPGAKTQAMTQQQLNAAIAQDVDLLQKALAQFK